MDRTAIFSEYARILRDSASWISTGWLEADEAAPFTIPSSRIPPDSGNVPISDDAKSLSLHKNDILPLRPDYASLSAMFPIPDAVSPGTGNPIVLDEIAKRIHACEKCNLCLTSGNRVPGQGAADARLMVVCAPAAASSWGKTGPMNPQDHEYLNKWLTALQLDIKRDVFITPALKCGPPGARPPHPEETAACAEYLRQQYQAVAPAAVLALGDTACGALTGDPRNFASLVAREWRWGTIPALVLWTPAEVLSSPNRLRRPVWDALQRFRAAW